MGIATLPTIQGYLVHEEIEAGGFGVVYRATQPLLGRDVAIKFILPHYANEPEFVRNFEAEAQRVARLEHPHIVPVYDYWRDPHGAYLVMRWLPRTLKSRLEQGALTLTETTRLLDQLADALATTHRQGVIHRDIKPGNILVDDQNNYYLTDFGIAKDLLSRVMTGSHIMKGTVAYIAPEQARGEVVSPQTDIYSLGVMLYEVLVGQHPFEGLSSAEMIVRHLNVPLPDLPPQLKLPMELNGVLQKATAKQPIDRFHDTLEFAQAFRACAPPTLETPLEGGQVGSVTEQPTTIGQPILRNPYKGLHAFELMDAGDFYGREALVNQLLIRLQEDHPFQHFLAVVGASGSGKSSVVKAGLLPALRAGCLPGSHEWFTVEMNPGEHPLQELTNALNRVATKPISHISEQLRADRRGLIWAIASLLSEDARLVLVVDQFEELFTTSVDEEEVAQFLEVLRVAASDVTSGVRVMITLRADFMDRPLQYLEFADLLKQRIEYVLPLSPTELAEAITCPAEQVGLQVEAGLVTAIVADVQDEPGALPLLQYTLTELFDQRDNHTLTLTAYEQLGGLSGALLQRADQIFEQFPSPQQDLIRQMFMRLVTLGEGVEDTRRRVRQTELLALVDRPGELMEVLERFGQARLLTFDRDPITREPTIEVAHEALIREWRRLRTWLDDSRYDIRQQRLLAAAAHEWAEAKRDKSYLLTGARLAQFEGWVGHTNVALTPHERAFVNASITENLRQQTIRRRVRNAALVAATLVALIMTGLSLVAFNQRSTARHERDNVQQVLVKVEREAAVNHSLVLASGAEKEAEDDTLSLMLALEAVNMEDPPAPSIQTLTNLAFGLGTRALFRVTGNVIQTVTFSSDSKLALSGSCATLVEDQCTKGELVLWDVETYAEVTRFVGHTDWVNSAVFSPDGSKILSGSSDNTLILWDVQTGEIIRRFEGHTGAVNGVIYSLDGQTAISGSDDGTLIQWDIETGGIIRRYEEHTDRVTVVALSPDGTMFASGSADRMIIVFDLASVQPIQRFTEHEGPIDSIAFRPGTNTILSASNFTMLEWDIVTGMVERNIGLGATMDGLSLSPDGNTAWVCTGQGANHFDLVNWIFADHMFSDTGTFISSCVFSPDGRLTLTGYRDGRLRLGNMPTTPEVRRFEAEVPMMSLGITPDGRYLLSGSYTGGVAILWDVATGQEIHRFENLAPCVSDLAISPVDHVAALGSADWWGGSGEHKLVLVNIDNGEQLHVLEGNQFFTRGLAFSRDGRYLLSGSLQLTKGGEGQGDLILWEVATGKMIRKFNMSSSVQSIDFSPDGRFALSSGMTPDGPVSVVLWNVSTGQKIRTFDDLGFGSGGMSVKWTDSPEDVLVNGTLLNIETASIVRRYEGRNVAIVTTDISPERGYIATGDNLGQIAMWDYKTGQEFRRFTAGIRRGWAWNVVFSPDGSMIFTSFWHETFGPIIQWQIADWPLDDLLVWVHENRYIRDFTCEERAQYRIEPLCE